MGKSILVVIRLWGNKSQSEECGVQVHQPLALQSSVGCIHVYGTVSHYNSHIYKK